MEADDSWAFYIRTAEHFLQSTEGDSGEAVSAILVEADDLRKVGDGLGALVVKWESIHKPVKLPKTWSRTPSDLAALAGEYNDRISEIEEALQGDALKLEALGEALGSPAWRKGILQKIDKAETEVSEITELLLKLFRDVPGEIGRVKAGAASGSPKASAAVASLETAVAEVTESFLKSAKAEDLPLERLQSLLSNAGNAAFAAIRSAEQAIEELKSAEDQQRQKKDEGKPAKKTTKKAAAKSKSVKSPAPAVPAIWFYSNGADESQQADLGVLAALIKDGVLTRQSHVWREGWPEWREMGQVEELAKLFGGEASTALIDSVNLSWIRRSIGWGMIALGAPFVILGTIGEISTSPPTNTQGAVGGLVISSSFWILGIWMAKNRWSRALMAICSGSLVAVIIRHLVG